MKDDEISKQNDEEVEANLKKLAVCKPDKITSKKSRRRIPQKRNKSELPQGKTTQPSSTFSNERNTSLNNQKEKSAK